MSPFDSITESVIMPDKSPNTKDQPCGITVKKDTRVQPWKSHWSPASQLKPGFDYDVGVGGNVVTQGN